MALPQLRKWKERNEAVGVGELTVLAGVEVAFGAEPVAGSRWLPDSRRSPRPASTTTESLSTFSLYQSSVDAAAVVVDDAALVTDDAALVAVEVTDVTGLVSEAAEATPSNTRIRTNAPAPARTRRISQRTNAFAPTAHRHYPRST